MATKWIHRLIIIIPVDDTEVGNAVHTLNWPGGDAEALTFAGQGLSATGLPPATHVGTFTSATDLLWTEWHRRWQAGHYGPNVQWWRLDKDNTVLLETNTADELGQPWGWREALASAGLQIIEPEDI